jgi:hypothetical protein
MKLPHPASPPSSSLSPPKKTSLTRNCYIGRYNNTATEYYLHPPIPPQNLISPQSKSPFNILLTSPGSFPPLLSQPGCPFHLFTFSTSSTFLNLFILPFLLLLPPPSPSLLSSSHPFQHFSLSSFPLHQPQAHFCNILTLLFLLSIDPLAQPLVFRFPDQALSIASAGSRSFLFFRPFFLVPFFLESMRSFLLDNVFPSAILKGF